LVAEAGCGLTSLINMLRMGIASWAPMKMPPVLASEAKEGLCK